MDVMELAKQVAGMSDRVLLVLVVVLAVRYLAARDEKKTQQMAALYERANSTALEVTKVLMKATEVMERVIRKLE